MIFKPQASPQSSSYFAAWYSFQKIAGKRKHIRRDSTQTRLAIPKNPKHKPTMIDEKEKPNMSSKNNNKINVPEARAAMDKFKMEAAAEVGVNLKEGYNGDLSSREAGSVGGQMVKKMIESYEKSL